MRALIRAAAVSVFGFLSLVGPVSAATSPQVIAQQPPAAGLAKITGTVSDSRGNGLAGATVTVSGPENKSTTTLSDGSYIFTLPPGVYTVFASHGGFQGSQSDPIAIVAGATTTANATLVESNLQSLRTIGRTSTTGSGRSTFNVSEASVSTLPSVQITIRQNPTLTDIVATLPGVVAQRTFSATPNTNFDIRGAALQTRVTIDGHPISSGIAGQWNTNYANSLIFQDVEVVKGPGLNGSIAGESAVGTVNLRTRDFTVNNSAGVMYGQDSYQGGIYNVYADVNFLPGNRASLIVQKAFTSLNGPWGFTDQIRAGNTNVNLKPIATGMAPNLLGLAQWTGDFSNAYSLEAELAKLRLPTQRDHVGHVRVSRPARAISAAGRLLRIVSGADDPCRRVKTARRSSRRSRPASRTPRTPRPTRSRISASSLTRTPGFPIRSSRTTSRNSRPNSGPRSATTPSCSGPTRT